MTSQKYKILYDPGEGEIVEKKSRFIAHTAAVNTEEEAQEFIEKIRKQYWDARHHCWAYRLGTIQPVERCSDDGEPSGTAGKPILEVIQGENIFHIVVVVTRYFGGTLLGTGGLIRAYTKSAQEGIRNSRVVEKCLGQELLIACDYTVSGKIQYWAATEQIPLIGIDYTQEVVFHMIVEENQTEAVKEKLIEISSGKAQITELGEKYFVLLEEGVEILEA